MILTPDSKLSLNTQSSVKITKSKNYYRIKTQGDLYIGFGDIEYCEEEFYCINNVTLSHNADLANIQIYKINDLPKDKNFESIINIKGLVETAQKYGDEFVIDAIFNKNDLDITFTFEKDGVTIHFHKEK